MSVCPPKMNVQDCILFNVIPWNSVRIYWIQLNWLHCFIVSLSIVFVLMNWSRMSYSLALGAVAVHAVLYRLVAGLADSPTGHLYSQTRLCAPLDASLQLPALCIHCRETGKHTQVNTAAKVLSTKIILKENCLRECYCSQLTELIVWVYGN